jgi:hypothetical protein
MNVHDLLLARLGTKSPSLQPISLRYDIQFFIRYELFKASAIQRNGSISHIYLLFKDNVFFSYFNTFSEYQVFMHSKVYSDSIAGE